MTIAGATVGLALAAGSAFADIPEIVVEAAAPKHDKVPGQPPGGAQVDLLSVRYHVHTAGLDLSRHADVEKLQQQIKEAATRGCKDIRAGHPTASLSDESECVKMAIDGAMAQAKPMIDAAAKKPAK
jgi:UrcA family protein